VKQAYTSVSGTVKIIFKMEGIKGFYKGLGVNIIRVLPGTCITFGIYEAMVDILRRNNE
jgi:solute carrier family 25 folate transporter 32